MKRTELYINRYCFSFKDVYIYIDVLYFHDSFIYKIKTKRFRKYILDKI